MPAVMTVENLVALKEKCKDHIAAFMAQASAGLLSYRESVQDYRAKTASPLEYIRLNAVDTTVEAIETYLKTLAEEVAAAMMGEYDSMIQAASAPAVTPDPEPVTESGSAPVPEKKKRGRPKKKIPTAVDITSKYR